MCAQKEIKGLDMKTIHAKIYDIGFQVVTLISLQPNGVHVTLELVDLIEFKV